MPPVPQVRDVAKERTSCWRPISDEEVPHLEALGAALRHERDKRGLTLAALGEAAEMSSSQVQRIEHGTRRTRRSTLERLATVLGSFDDDADELLERFLDAAGPALAGESAYRERVERRRRRRAERRERLEANPFVRALIEERARELADEMIWLENRAARTYWGKRIYRSRSAS